MTRLKSVRVMGYALSVVSVVVGAPLVGLALIRGGDSPSRNAPKAVEMDRASPPSADLDNDFVGVLLPPLMADLSPRMNGKVLAVRAKTGQVVHAGEVIVAFDLRESQHEVAMAEAQLRVVRAESAAAYAESAAARARAVRRTATIRLSGKLVDLVSKEERGQAQSEAHSAAARAASVRARIAEQEAKVDQLRVALEESELRAPFDGVVSFVNFEPASRVQAGEVVARVVGGQGLRARIAVPEEASSALRLRRVRILVENRELTASLDQVTPEPEPASRAFIVEVIVHTSGMSDEECGALASRPIRASFFAQ